MLGVAFQDMGIGVRMPMIAVDRRIEASANDVWRILVDLDAWPVWGPSVRAAETEGGERELGPESRGRVQTALLVEMPFAVTEFEAGRRWAWAVAGVPATAHEVSGDATRCRVRFEVPCWAIAYLPVCAAALRRIDALATETR